MQERALVAFTLLTQIVVGAFVTLLAFGVFSDKPGSELAPALLVLGGLMAVAMLASLFHLGNPQRAWRAATNLRASWLSREILFTLLFAGLGGLHALAIYRGTPSLWLAWLTAATGIGLLYCMARVYLLRTTLAWNSWRTPWSFFSAAYLLGSLLGWGLAALSGFPGAQSARPVAGLAFGLVCLELGLLLGDQWGMKEAYERLEKPNPRVRRLRLGLLLAGAAVLAVLLWPATPLLPGIGLALSLILLAELLGREEFYRSRTTL